MKCPECGRKDFTSKISLGHHRSKEHGVRTKAAEYQRLLNQRRKAALEGASPSVLTVVASNPSSTSAQSQERSYAKHSHRSADAIPLELIAYTVGRVEAQVHAIAVENEIPGKIFARWCAEYFLKSASR